MAEHDADRVRIVDVDMPFGSMVKFMVKWAIASIPAFIILVVIGVVLTGVFGSLRAALSKRSAASLDESSYSTSTLDSILAATAPPLTPSDPTWSVSESTNPIDDSPTVIVSLDASSPTASGLRGRPSLILRCKSKSTDLYINWNDFLGSDEIAVTTRVGREPASKRSWGLSTDNEASFYPGQPIAFIKKLMEVDTLVAVTTPYNESPMTAVFAVTGLSAEIEPLRKACGW